MKTQKKTILYTCLFLLIFLLALSYFFNINISIPSSDIAFSPGNPIVKTNADSIAQQPKNIIVFIADGMGFSHLSLAMLTQQTENVTSVWQRFDVKGWHDPRTTYGPLTDSGASGTAMATGTPTFFEVIGQNADGQHQTNLLELAQAAQYSTGIVTDSYIWDATPAAFVAHTKSRDNAEDILNQIASSKLDLIFGELEDVGEDEVPELEPTMEILRKRYHILDKSLQNVDLEAITQPIAAIYDEDEVQDLDSSPNLPQLTDLALQRLLSKGKPFAMMVESEEMDAASHANDSDRVVKGLASIQQTLALILDFAEKDGETLVLFTADHETGGLAAVADYDRYPHMQIRWSTMEHTAAVVPILAMGPGAEYFADVHRAWEIGAVLKQMVRSE